MQELLWITIFTQLPGIGFESNKYTSFEALALRKKDQKACISSRITTVIHVV